MRWKLLLRPSWLAMTVAVFAFAATCFAMLGPWQFDRHDERSAQNDAVQESLQSEPEPLDTVLGANRPPDEQSQWSRVTVTGHYLPEGEVVARLRTVQGEPAFEVLTPMRTRDGQSVLINRGYVRPDDSTQVPRFDDAPSGEVTVTARARIDEPVGDGDDPVTEESGGGQPQTYNVSSATVSELTNIDLRSGYFQLEADQPGVLSPLPLPRTSAGPFFSYALQWIAFGSIALLGWLYFTIRELKPGGSLNTTRCGTDRGDDRGDDAAQNSGTPTTRRKSVAQILAEDEAAESASDRPSQSRERANHG